MQYFFFDDPDLAFDYLTVTRWVGSLGPPYDSPFGPSTYLGFAADDLAGGDERGLVNAFGNVKRCLHLSVDTLLHQYALFPYARRLAFPDRLALLDRIDVLPTSIIRNLNVERNAMEHDYVCPDRTRVEEALDVARLLQLAIERLLERIPVESVIGWRVPRKHVVMRLEPGSGELTLSTLRAPGQFSSHGATKYFSGPLRAFGDGSLRAGVTVAGRPWRTIPLKKATENEWVPIIRELVSVQRSQAFGGTQVGHSGLLTTTVTLPFPFDHQHLAEFLDEGARERSSARGTSPSGGNGDPAST